MEKKPVEKYKLTPEQMEWTKAYGKLMKISKFLQAGMAQQMSKAQRLGDMLRQTEGGLQDLINRAPERPTTEIEGQ